MPSERSESSTSIVAVAKTPCGVKSNPQEIHLSLGRTLSTANHVVCSDDIGISSKHSQVLDQNTSEHLQHQESLRSRINSASSITSTVAGISTGFNDLTKMENPEMCSESSPSATLSGSLSKKPQGLRRVSGASLNSLGSKIPSRIPVSGSRKSSATEFKSTEPSLTPYFHDSDELSTGSRQLTSSNALKMLEHGNKHHQQIHDPSGSNAYSSKFFSRNSSPKFTSQIGLSDLNTPRDSNHKGERLKSESLDNPTKDTTSSTSMASLFEEEDFVTAKAPPPSNSPFTEPLETIPSQVIFPAPRSDPVLPESERVFAISSENTGLHDDPSTSHRSVSNSWNANSTTTTSKSLSLRSKFSQAFDNETDDSRYDLSNYQHKDDLTSFMDSHVTPSPCDIDHEDMEQLLGPLKVRSTKSKKQQMALSDSAFEDRYPARTFVDGNKDSHHAGDTIADTETFTRSNVKQPSLIPAAIKLSPQHDSSDRKGARKPVANKNVNLSSRMKPLPKKPSIIDTEPSIDAGTQRDLHPARSVSTGLQRFPLRTSSCLPPPQGVPGSVRSARERMHLRKNYKEKLSSSPEPRPAGNVLATEMRAAHRAQRKTSGSPITPLVDHSATETNPVKFNEQSLDMNKEQTPEGSGKKSAEHLKSRSVFGKLNGLFSTKRDKKTSSSLGAKHKSESTPVKSNVGSRQGDWNVLSSKETSPAEGVTGTESGRFTAVRQDPIDPIAALEDIRPRSRAEKNMLGLIEKLIERAQEAETPRRKLNLLAFAEVSLAHLKEIQTDEDSRFFSGAFLIASQIFSDVVLETRQVQINSIRAEAIAKQTQMSNEMVQRSLTTLHRLAEVIMNDNVQ